MSQFFTNAISISEVGVLLIGFNRPELLKKRIDEISRFKLEFLYISVDGGIESHTAEMETVKNYAQSKFSDLKYFNLTHHEDNMGLVKHMTKEITKVLDKHNYIIVIEDDVKLSENFMSNILNGLNLQKLMGKNGVVCGWSPVSTKVLKNSWRKTLYPLMWGWACSRLVWEEYTYDLSDINIESNLNYSDNWKNYSKFQKSNWLEKFNRVKYDPLWTWEMQFFYHCLVNDFYFLAPIFSITGNEGFSDPRAIHTKGIAPRFLRNNAISNKKIYNYSKFLHFFVTFIEKMYFNDIKIIRLVRNKLNHFI